ncbi:MAG: DEAD/DEAH box helicase [candidate division KSB1 bacterium]|nr:DEAD/DEAH box helicase [candidate division KSB1 bacterium]MDZ7367169.1 DEAD/DEAH box helicase [candidate division KSB1 bacterium]MDZ7405348.1 DEAD/DEAH box helicase [candidate division KSB1 bacterium]
MRSKNIPAECINSEQETAANRAILERAKKGQLKVLYIAPERQEDQAWLEAVRRINLAMVVIDEAHCISVWEHDFRPAFRRIINLVRLLTKNFPGK